MGGADHFRVEKDWRDPAEAVAFAREVARRFGTGDVGFGVDVTASSGPLLERLLPYLPEELRVEGRLAHPADLVTDPDLLHAAYIEASQWLTDTIGVHLAGPPGPGPQAGLAYPDRPFVPRGASRCALTLDGKGLMRGDPEVRDFLSARLDACRRAGLLPSERASDALLDALVVAWETQLPSEETEEYTDAEIAGAPPPPVEVDGVVLAYYGGTSRWRRWTVCEPTRLLVPVRAWAFADLAGMDGLWLPGRGVDLVADLPTEAAIVLGRREGCRVAADLQLEPSDEELAALLPHLRDDVARIEWSPVSWLDAAAGGYNAVTVWVGQDCRWTASPGLIEVSLSVNYKTEDPTYGGSEGLSRHLAKALGVTLSYQYRE